MHSDRPNIINDFCNMLTISWECHHVYCTQINIKLTLKDIQVPEYLQDGRLYCEFRFKGSKVVTYETKPQFAWVQMTIDGSQLAALAGTEVKIPLWVQTHGDFNSLNNKDNHVETEKDGVITIVDYFRVVQDNFYIVMRDPRLIFSISGTNTLTVENYKDHLKCQITSPTVSEFKDLKLNFDDKRFVWEAELVDLKLLEGYDLTVKCTRAVNKVMLYGYDMTPTTLMSRPYPMTCVRILQLGSWLPSLMIISNIGTSLLLAQPTFGSKPPPQTKVYQHHCFNPPPQP